MILYDFHGYVLQTFIGVSFIFPLIMLCLKVFRIQSPKQRMGFYLLGLVMPFMSFMFLYTFVTKGCREGVHTNSALWHVFDLLCQIALNALIIVGPLIVFLTILLLLKGLAGILYLSRMRKSSVEPIQTHKNILEECITKRCKEWQLPIPEVIFVQRKGFAALVMGWFKPTILVNNSILQYLNEKEMEMLITHELIHIRHKDYRKGWFIYLVRYFMFFSPFSRHLLKGYMVERERLCDQETANLLWGVKAYAATLLKIWRILIEEQEALIEVPVGFVGSEKEMEYRITTLLSGKKEIRKVSTRKVIVLQFALSIIMVIFLGFIC